MWRNSACCHAAMHASPCTGGIEGRGATPNQAGSGRGGVDSTFTFYAVISFGDFIRIF